MDKEYVVSTDCTGKMGHHVEQLGIIISYS